MGQQLDVLLVNPSNSYDEFTAEHNLGKNRKYGMFPPLGHLYLAAACRENGFSVELLDSVAEELSLEGLLDRIREKNPRIVALNSTTYQTRGLYQVATALRREFGDKIVLALGGSHITSCPAFFERFPLFDFAVLGEGEVTFPQLVGRVLKGEKPKGVFKAELPRNLDELPFPARDVIDLGNYFFPGQAVATLLFSRGCPYHCIYCCSLAVSKIVRYRSAANVADEIERLKPYYKSFWFLDDTMTTDRGKTIELCKEFIRRKLDIEWDCLTRVNLVDEELLNWMKKAGCKTIAFGVESGSDRIRREIINKRCTEEQIETAFRLCRKIGIRTSCFLMMGFPTETMEELEMTVKVAGKLKASEIGIHLTNIFPGTGIFDIAVKEGKTTADVFYDYAEGKIKIADLPRYVPDGLSIDDLRDARQRAYISFYFTPRFILSRLKNTLTSLQTFKDDLEMAKILLLEGRTPPELH